MWAGIKVVGFEFRRHNPYINNIYCSCTCDEIYMHYSRSQCTASNNWVEPGNEAMYTPSQSIVWMSNLPVLVSFLYSEQENEPETLLRTSGQHLSEDTRVELRRYYAEEKYPSALKKEEIASKLELHYITVDNWFRNERLKERSKPPAKKSKHMALSQG